MRISTFVLAPLLAACLALPAQAQVYRWVDVAGNVHYTDALPPPGAQPTVIGALANGGFLSALAVAVDAPRAAVTDTAEHQLTPPAAEPRGLEFRKYLSLQRGMSEGEMFVIAGPPDLASRDRSFSTWTYLPTAADPFTTTIDLVRGRISEIERVRRF